VPFVSIFTTNGQQTVSNPLYSYTFQSDAAGNGFPPSNPLANLACTVRHWDGKTNLSDHPAANAAMASTAPGLLSASYRVFSDTSDYTAFSTTAMLPNRTSTTGNNIEIIHNQIHNNLGGYGHMSWLELAAFDPIFWLHHANVDRMFAMWQALYPGTYVAPARNQIGSYYESIGTMDSGSSDLAPFHSTEDGTSMWTSDAVRSTAVFDYSYPELPDWTLNSSALADHVRSEINRLYNPPAPAGRKRSIPRKTRRAASIAEAFSHVTFDDAKMLGVNNANRQWFASIQMDRFAYSTSFAIYFFMGDPPADASQWSWAPNLIGAHAQFISADLSSMHPDGLPTARVRGEVSLTHTLLAGVDRGMLPNLGPEAVVPLLKQGLQWRARAPGGCEIDATKLTGLMISIGSKSVKPTTCPQQFPVYGDAEWYSEVTQNAPCDVKRKYRLAR
jgi:tyrosinase